MTTTRIKQIPPTGLDLNWTGKLEIDPARSMVTINLRQALKPRRHFLIQ